MCGGHHEYRGRGFRGFGRRGFPDRETWVERLKTYEELAPTLQDRLRDIDYVDMRFDARVYVKDQDQDAYEDLLWALVNSAEFRFNR